MDAHEQTSVLNVQFIPNSGSKPPPRIVQNITSYLCFKYVPCGKAGERLVSTATNTNFTKSAIGATSSWDPPYQGAFSRTKVFLWGTGGEEGLWPHLKAPKPHGGKGGGASGPKAPRPKAPLPSPQHLPCGCRSALVGARRFTQGHSAAPARPPLGVPRKPQRPLSCFLYPLAMRTLVGSWPWPCLCPVECQLINSSDH